MNTHVKIVQVDFSNAQHLKHLAAMLLEYSKDIMGGGEALSPQVIENSISLLAEKNYAVSFLAYDNEQAIGFANCFENIATFKGRTALNIHDIAVIPSFRKQGVATALLGAIETYARKNNMAKITLEVLGGNHPAKSAYSKFGFQGYQLDPKMGEAVFWQKMLNAQ